MQIGFNTIHFSPAFGGTTPAKLFSGIAAVCEWSIAAGWAAGAALASVRESRASAHIMSAKKPTMPTAIPKRRVATLKNTLESDSMRW